VRRDRGAELARELRGGAGKPLRPEADGATEERLAVREDDDVARDGAEVHDRDDPFREGGHETDEVGDREGPEPHTLRLRAEGALYEIDPILHLGGLRDADEDGELLALLLACPREQAVVEDGLIEIERERSLELERQHLSELCRRARRQTDDLDRRARPLHRDGNRISEPLLFAHDGAGGHRDRLGDAAGLYDLDARDPHQLGLAVRRADGGHFHRCRSDVDAQPRTHSDLCILCSL